MNTDNFAALRPARGLASLIRQRLAARSRGQSGLTLLDLLLGMAIFSIVAIIAVSAMSSFRERAYVAQAKEEGKTVAQVKEEAGVKPSAADSEPVAEAEPSEPVTVPWVPILLGTGALLCLSGAGAGGVILRRDQKRRTELADEASV